MPHNPHDKTYNGLLRHLVDGYEDTLGYQMSFNRKDGFAFITTAAIAWGEVVRTMTDFIQNRTPQPLPGKGNFVERRFSQSKSEYGYHAMFFKWPNPYGGYIDQVQDLIEGLKATPEKKNFVISNWNASFVKRLPELPNTLALHFVCQPASVDERLEANNSKAFNVGEPKHKLSLFVKQLNEDVYYETPKNVAFYALFLEAIAAEAGMFVNRLVYSIDEPYFLESDRQKLRDRLSKPSCAPARCSINNKNNFRFRELQNGHINFTCR